MQGYCLGFCVLVVAVAVANCGAEGAESGFAGRPITNSAFAETGYTLHRDEFTIGLGRIEYGLGENVQMGTNLLLWAFQVYNGDLKVALTKNDERAYAAGVAVYSLSLKDEDTDEEGDYMALMPYLAGTWRVAPNTLFHAYGRYAYLRAEDDDNVDEPEPDEISSGTGVYVGIEHSRTNRTKFLADIGYDATYDGVRAGGAVLFGWTTFRLKFGLSYFAAGDGFFFPIIGLWWRFEA
jgi:hypothetical protein